MAEFTLVDPQAIADEEEIVWGEEVTTLRFVREELVTWAKQRRRPIRWDGPGRRVGYSVLRRDAQSENDTGYRGRYFFTRRLFWVRDNDGSEASPYHPTGLPCEGVDPLSVAPGVPGRQTERAWGGPLPGSRGDQQP